MKNFKITEAMSMEDQENIIKNIKMVLDQLPAAKAQMKASGASEQDIRNFQAPILKFLDDARREMDSTAGDEAIAAARKELGGMFEEKEEKMENLNEGKKKKMSYMAELAEIDKQSAIVAMEAKINKLDEMIEAKNARLNMVNEDENLSELIDKKRVKEMQREIKILEKEKSKMERMYEKMHGKKKKEMVDEEEKMDEGGYGNYEEDDSQMEAYPHRDPMANDDVGDIEEGKHDEIDEAHCSEEDDTDSMNEEFLRMQKLAGL